ncbi:MAG TPA: hypothetical protein VHA33_05220 [Candidatus Angelobacter sp.]|jgi:hypothetical protein|nr:hypothetical protein [Candidatus Angelobacter sp.]
MRRILRRAIFVWIAASLGSVALQAQPKIWTQHNNNSRIGSNTSETILKPANVNVRKFGKLFSYALDDQTYSQPLYIPGLVMEVDGQTHNVVFVTTVSNTVYAWDADSYHANGGHPLWKRNLTPPPPARVPSAKDMSDLGACGGQYHDFAGNLGMVGTPVIDADSKTLYVVSHIIDDQGKHVQRLHALDITSGKDKLEAREIKAKIKTKYADVEFNPVFNNQRPALTLVGDVVYIGWSSYCDSGDYHGWVMGYKASNLSQVTAWSTTTTGERGGFWQSGQGLMVDDKGSLILVTGNGSSDEEGNYSESVVKLSPNPQGALQVSSFFTPNNWVFLNDKDLDFGSAGMLPLPGTTLIAGGGKEGMFYLIDADSRLPQFKLVQSFQAVWPSPGTASMHIHGSPVYYEPKSRVKPDIEAEIESELQSDAKSETKPEVRTDKYLYLWGENDFLRVFEFIDKGGPPHLKSTAVAVSAMRAPQILAPTPPNRVPRGGMPGGFLSISGNGHEDGILWALAVYACNANQHVEPGILYAFDASDFLGRKDPTAQLRELWNSKEYASRDDVGYFAKFTYPTIINGKVYVAGWGAVPSHEWDKCAPKEVPSDRGQLNVYGLLPAP